LVSSKVAQTVIARDAGLVDGVMGEIIADPQGFSGFANGAPCQVKGNGSLGVKVSVRPVTQVRRSHYEGPVYNFETDNGLIVSDGILSHNCRCRVRHAVDWFADID